MRHRLQKRSSFGLKPGPRLALIRNLVSSLVEHERIKTTLPKAREISKRAERAITLGKLGSLSAKRLLLSRLPQPSVVSKIMNELSPRLKERPGGFTRIIKLGKRKGDSAEMAYVEWVDYDPSKKTKTKEEGKAAEKKEKSHKKKLFLQKKKRKKHLRKMKLNSRRVNRH